MSNPTNVESGFSPPVSQLSGDIRVGGDPTAGLGLALDPTGQIPWPQLSPTGPWGLKGILSPDVITSDQNDYNPPGLAGANTLLLRPSGDHRKITGLQGGWPGQVLFVYNMSLSANNKNLILAHASTSSSALNRFMDEYRLTAAQVTETETIIPPRTGVVLQYLASPADTANSYRWCVVSQPTQGYYPSLDVTSNTTLSTSQAGTIVMCNMNGGPFTITLPTLVGGVQALWFLFVGRFASNNLTIACDAGSTIDGASTLVLNTDHTVRGLVYAKSSAELNRWWTFSTGGSPTGTAGGDLSGTYPNPSVVDDSHAHTGTTLSAVTEANQTLADNTTNDVSITKHGYAPKAPNDTAKFLRGDATWAASAGGAPSGAAGGDLTGTYPNPTLAAAGPGATGPLGSATVAPIITIDAKGRVTALTSTTITGTARGGAAGGDLSGTYPNPVVGSSHWETQAVSANTTLVDDSAPIVNYDTTAGAFAVTLPATPTTGSWFLFINTGGSANALTIARNGKLIDGTTADFVFDLTNVIRGIIYDGTGWRSLEKTRQDRGITTWRNPGSASTPNAETIISPGSLSIHNEAATTTTPIQGHIVGARSTGTAAAGFGCRMQFDLEDAAGSDIEAVRQELVWTVATAGATTSAFRIYTQNAGTLGLRHETTGLGEFLVGPTVTALASGPGVTTPGPVHAGVQGTLMVTTQNQILAAGYGAVVSSPFEIGSGFTYEIGSGATLEILA